MLSTVIVPLAIVSFLFYHLYWKRRGLPPGPTPWPFLGNVPGIIAKAPGYAAFREWKSEYGPVFTYWYGRHPIVTINDYDILMETLQNDATNYSDRFLASEILRLYKDGEWGIVDTSGELWQEHRRFALKTMRDFGMGKNVMEQKVLTEVASMSESLRQTNGEPIEIIKYFDLAVGGIINNVLLGKRFDDSNIDEFRKLRHLLQEQSKVIYHPSFLLLMIFPSLRHFPYLKQAWKTIKTCSDNLFAFFREQITAHESEIDLDTEQESTDLCEAYLRERKRLQELNGDDGVCTLKQLESVLYDLWVAGLETTTGTLAWAVAYLLHHPDVQTRARKEVDSVLERDQEFVTTEHRANLPYCCAVIMEVQRLANIIPLNFQRVTSKDTMIGGYKVKKGTAIMPQISSVLYNEKIFPDPYSFDPERFMNLNGQLKRMDEWLPFSVGARRCPGEALAKMELFLFLTNLIYNFEILPEDIIPTMDRTATTVQKPADHMIRLMITFTVQDAIESAGFGKFQIILSIIGGFSWMADSMEVMLLSLLAPSLVCEWGITPVQQALSTTFVFLGWMISSPIWGRICDVYGRKKGLISASLLGFTFGIVTAFTPSFTTFLIARAFVGFAVGGVPQSVTMTAEFLPVTHRAKCLTFLKFFWAIGAATEAIIAVLVMPTLGWRWLVALSSTPLALFALSCWWLPESARYHVAHGELGEARRTLERVARYNGKKLPEGELVSEKVTKSSIGALLHKEHRRVTLQIWIIWVLFGLLYYGITIYSTQLFRSGDECHGGVSLNATAVGITPRCKQLRTGDYLDIVTTSFAELPGLFITMITIETIGRRATFALQFTLFAVGSASLSFCMSRSVIVGVLFVARAVMAGAFQTGYIYTAEVYPTTLRALGLGTAGGFARIGSMVTPIVAQVISAHSMILPALIYAVGGLVGAVTAILLPIETKGRAMTDNN